MRLYMFPGGGSLILTVVTGCLLFSFARQGGMILAASAQSSTPGDAKAQADVTKALDNKRLRGITVKVSGGVATLTGSVSDFQDKQDADKKIEKFIKVGELSRVEDQVQVSGPVVSDEVLAKKLGGSLVINDRNPDRTAFEFINPSVQDGAVTLNGFVTDPTDKSDAEGLVAQMTGVKNIIDHIQVGPASPNDWRVRHDVYQAIYGYSTFTRYGINPQKPIRIIVLNGNVILVGVVDSQSDKDQANIRANGVGGVFKVTNNLQVQGARE